MIGDFDFGGWVSTIYNPHLNRPKWASRSFNALYIGVNGFFEKCRRQTKTDQQLP